MPKDCHSTHVKEDVSPKVIQKECICKAYRTLYNHSQNDPSLEERLDIKLTDPRYISTESEKEELEKIFDKLPSMHDLWIMGYLNVFDSYVLFNTFVPYVCPRVMTLYNRILNF